MRVTISFILEPVSYFLSGIFLFYFLRIDKRIKLKVLCVYYFLATILMVKANFTNSRITNNIETYNILCLLSFTCLGVYFYQSFLLSWKKKLVVAFCLLEGVYFVTVNFLSPHPLLFDSMGQVILSIAVVIMVFMFMHQILTNVTEESLWLNFDFWFVSAQFMYHLGAFFIFLTVRNLTNKIMSSDLYSDENRYLLGNLWGVHNVLLFLSALLISASIVWISFRRKSQSSS